MNMKKSYIWMMSSKILGIFGALFTAGLINRELGPYDRGILAEMQTWVTLFAVIFGLSLDTAIYHFMNRVLYTDSRSDKFTTIFLLNLVYSLIASASMFLLIWAWHDRLSAGTTQYVILLMILLVATMFATNLAVFFQADGRIKESALVSILQVVVNVTVVGLAFYIKLINLKFVLLSLIAVQAIGVLLFAVYAVRRGLFHGNFKKALARLIISAGFKQHTATVFTFLYTKANQLILIKYEGEVATGLFAVPLNLIFGLVIIPATLQTVLYPRVIHSDDDYDVTIKTISLTFYIWGFIVLMMYLFARPILTVYGGEEYLASVSYFRILLFSAWLLPLSSMISPYMIKKGAFVLSSWSAVVIGIISLSLNYLLIPKFSATGAALATSISCIVGFFIAIMLLNYKSKRNAFEFLFLWRSRR